MKGKEKEQRYLKRDYGHYHFTVKEFMKYTGQAAGLCAVADYLFYRSAWVLLLMLPALVFYLKWQQNRMIRERRKKLNYQFKDALTSLSVAVQAGYSVESAIKTCVRDLERLYGKGADIVEEFRYIESQQHISVPLEELFLDLGSRSQVEDIENFASVFYTAKRTGGDMNRVIQKVARMLGDKIDVKKRNRSNSGFQEIGANDHESYACGYHYVFTVDLAGLLKCSLWKSLWNCSNEYLSCYLCYGILAWQKDRRY